eukprot:TRINITY_DN5470_c0_g1_i1.p1 TRINITY_DN5470_c0_g1~~TRINITY_DN5470_c0_g1_i1.p1  ORF type:complete len:164 (-),score=34.83 TRINITY_DN5470_c0_g1_i1:121-612(-)
MMTAEEERGVEQKPHDGRYAKNHRALLFGSRFGNSNKENPKGQTAAALYAAVERSAIEEHNDVLTEKLQEKVVELKDLSLGISSETSKSLQATEDMNGQLDGAMSLLSRTQEQLQSMAKQPGSRHLCLMVLFVILLIILLFLFSRFRGASRGPAAFLAPHALS